MIFIYLQSFMPVYIGEQAVCVYLQVEAIIAFQLILSIQVVSVFQVKLIYN